MDSSLVDATEAPSHEALIAQLQILNERSRWYSSQLWQVPFIYVAAAGTLINQALDKDLILGGALIFLSGLLGVIVSIHMKKLKQGEERAVKALISVESNLGFLHKAEHRKEYTDILYYSVYVMGVGLIVVGFIFVFYSIYINHDYPLSFLAKEGTGSVVCHSK